MVSQADFVKVNGAVIEHLRKFYNQELNAPMIDAMINDLAEFSQAHLQEAMINLRRRSIKPPTTYQIMTECKELQKKSGDYKPKMHAVESSAFREKKAYDMVTVYLSNWIPGSEAETAKQGGYYDDAEKYVREVAGIQAAFIYGITKGYSCSICFPHLPYPTQDIPIKEFFDVQRTQAVKGDIKVKFPEELVEYWKKCVKWKNPKALSSPAARAIPVSTPLCEPDNLLDY